MGFKSRSRGRPPRKRVPLHGTIPPAKRAAAEGIVAALNAAGEQEILKTVKSGGNWTRSDLIEVMIDVVNGQQPISVLEQLRDAGCRGDWENWEKEDVEVELGPRPSGAAPLVELLRKFGDHRFKCAISKHIRGGHGAYPPCNCGWRETFDLYIRE